MSKREAEIIDFHYHKDKEYEPKTFIAITFLGLHTKTPPEHDGYASKLFTIRTDAFFKEITREELSKEIGKFLAEKLQNEGYEIEKYDCIGTMWCDPTVFGATMCDIMKMNGFDVAQKDFDSFKEAGEKILKK